MSTDTKAELEGKVAPEAAPFQTEAVPSSIAGQSPVAMKTDPEDTKDEDLESEDVDEEEALLLSIEIEKEKEEKEEAAHPHAQPSEITAAPRLLQDALKKGVVTADDSEEEDEAKVKEKKTGAGSPEKPAKLKADDSESQEEKKGDDEPVVPAATHFHARVSCNPCQFLRGDICVYPRVLWCQNSFSHNVVYLSTKHRQTSSTFCSRKLPNIPILSPATFKSCRNP